MQLGDIVEHILNKEWLIILEINDNKVKCRTKQFEIIEFYDFELRKKR
ncbi:MAG: hypothetical protein ACOC2W_00775 [bacterium]